MVTLAADRLRRLDSFLARYVDDGRLPGWQLAITAGDDLAHFSSYGQRDVEAGLPVADDTIFRIYSMTKPITSVAAMRLWERGEFMLNEPVAKYLPAFGASRVWRGGSSLKPLTGPVTEPMRIWHLLTHTSGLTYGFLRAHVVDELYRNVGFELTMPDGDLATIVDQLATLPLLFQPGAEWNYGMSTDVLGRLVEVIAGKPLADVIADEVLDPLGMTDTAWYVTADTADRLAALYVPNPFDDGKAVRYDDLGKFASMEPQATMGGGGLVGTTADYVRFTQMLRRRGRMDSGEQLLSPETVDYMASNHLPGNADLTAYGRPLFAETTFDGTGFGLGFSVAMDPVAAKVPYSTGEFGWGGAASTTFWVDPKLDMTVVFMTQLLPSDTHPIRVQLRQLVKAAVR